MNRVSTQFFKIATPEEPLPLLESGSLNDADVAYQTWGDLNEDKSNAILIFHALSGSQHASGLNPEVESVGARWTRECQTGWWNDFVGVGKAVDTSKFFVICANYLGGCYGSTGPSSIDPQTSKPYGARFPKIRFADIVDSQIRLLNILGITQLHASIGASLGGLLGLTLATRHPTRVKSNIILASGVETTPLQRIHNFEQIFAVETDADFNQGNYPENKPPNKGLAVARIIGHKTYVSLGAMEERAQAEIITQSPELSWYDIDNPLESYMFHQSQKFVQRFDANTYLRILHAWQRFNLAEESGANDLSAALQKVADQKFLIFSIDSDVCFYPEEQAKLVRLLKESGAQTTRLTVHSEKGHDAFLLEPDLFEPYMQSFLND